ncbi:hypothetical protein FQA47_001090 [Oryzias melastigma]|uniref:Uncharacterized protein n=1 Tax=Oryzias melastigma TaxID=30732 RepID=A0A834BPP9_ORYME|nr:hypothetical protein FQA47_001090 [Oryzias melastigma]
MESQDAPMAAPLQHRTPRQARNDPPQIFSFNLLIKTRTLQQCAGVCRWRMLRVSFPRRFTPAQHRISGRSRAGKEADGAALPSPWIG